MLKKYSGIATKYFRLNNHLKYIFAGRAASESTKTRKTLYRAVPSFSKYFLKMVSVRIGGKKAKYPPISRNPKISRLIMFLGNPCSSHFTQTYSDKLTLVKAGNKCESQYWKGPKKFQLGPRKKVPMIINITHIPNQPNRKIERARLSQRDPT